MGVRCFCGFILGLMFKVWSLGQFRLGIGLQPLGFPKGWMSCRRWLCSESQHAEGFMLGSLILRVVQGPG